MDAVPAFLIIMHVEPAHQPEVTGSMHGFKIILTGAPSREKAESWAKDFAAGPLLNQTPSPKLLDLKIFPVHDSLLTGKGPEPIPWADLRARQTGSPANVPEDLGANVRFKPMHGIKASSPVTLAEFRKSAGERGNKWNWNEKKQRYYVAHTGSNAWLVKAVNISATLIPLLASKESLPPDDVALHIFSWPGVMQYGEPEAASS